MSTLNVDALVGNTSANAITVRGEGTATTSLQQGLAKCWINFEGDGTIATSDSFNVSGITDRTTGQYTVNINNDMNNGNYSVTGSGTHDSGSYVAWCCVHHDIGLGTGSAPIDWLNGSGTSTDIEIACATIHGDLA